MGNAILDVSMSFGERAAYSGRMILIGLGTVFAALGILCAVLVLFRLAVEKLGKKKDTAASAPIADPVPAPVPAEADNRELVAVITAAIAATLADEHGGEAPAFRVVSFRKLKSAKRG